MDARPKAPAIRADPTQAALLKAAFTVSCTPSIQAMHELSVQTGLPQKWINSWFGRQRTKARKSIEVIDMTTMVSSTVKTRQGATSANINKALKVEHQDSTSILDSEPPSSSPRSVAQSSEQTCPGKTTRKPARGTRKSKPKKNQASVKPEFEDTQLPRPPVVNPNVPLLGTGQPHLLPSVLGTATVGVWTSLQSRLPIPVPPTRSKAGLNKEQKTKKPKGSSEVTAGSQQTRSSRPINTRSKLAASANRSNLVSQVVVNGPALQGTHDRNQLVSASADLDPDLDASFSSELKLPRTDGMFTGLKTTHLSRADSAEQYTQNIKKARASYLPSQTTVNDITPFDAYQTVAVNSASLFLTTQNMLTQRDMNSSGYERDIAGSQIYTSHNTNVDGRTDYIGHNIGNTWTGTHSDAMYNIHGHGHYLPTLKMEMEGTLWNTTSDYLDLSHLINDGPFSHLEERLEPFRLPESRYLFGKCGMMDCLLDEKLGVEEPFQAAMGLVLLSKLGLEW